MASVSFLNLKRLHEGIRGELDQAIARVVDQSAFIQGEDCKAFEAEFAEWVAKGSHVVGCANGTDAISLAAKALGLKPGQEAILPAMTFIATAEALLAVGMKLKLVDVSEGTWTMDPDAVDGAMGPDTKLIVPVHLSLRPDGGDGSHL
jgi:UDP-2-acetamido-2-deoxy-ribo-hexuluronate aminotransferase